MSSLLSRIMLAMLMLPVASVLYIVTVWAMVDATSYRRREQAFLATGAIIWAFVAVYWTLLWRKTVRWNGRRVGRTLIAAAIAAGGAAVCGWVTWQVDDELGVFVSSVTPALLWLIMTVFVWRETADERADRLAGADVLVCPRCGYNLTGLREATCPECGARYTIADLVSQQPARQPKELR